MACKVLVRQQINCRFLKVIVNEIIIVIKIVKCEKVVDTTAGGN